MQLNPLVALLYMTVFCVISPIGIGVGLVLKEESVLETFVSFLEICLRDNFRRRGVRPSSYSKA